MNIAWTEKAHVTLDGWIRKIAFAMIQVNI